MKICLINSPYDGPIGGIWNTSFPPLSVLSLAAYLRRERPHHEIRVIDGLRIGLPAARQQALAYQADLYGVSCLTFTASTAYRLVDVLKAARPRAKVVVGGTHVTSLEQDAFHQSRTDIVVHGEGEQILVELVDTLENGGDLSSVRGLVFRAGQDLQRTPEHPLIEDLDSLPLPARDLVNMNDYVGQYVSREAKNTHLLSGRGCVNHCLFCARRVWKRQNPTLRLRSPASVVHEWRELNERYGIKEIFDMGDEVNPTVERAIELAQAIADARLGMVWQTFSRATPVTDGMAEALAASGCWQIHLGIESGNQRTLNGIHKNITLEMARQAAQTYQRHGIKVVGLFMLFHAWEEEGRLCYENARDSLVTMRFARSLLHEKAVNSITCSPALPYPGSKLWDVAQRHRLISPARERGWEMWDHSFESVMEIPGTARHTRRLVKLWGMWIQGWSLVFSGQLSLRSTVWKRLLGMLWMGFRRSVARLRPSGASRKEKAAIAADGA